MIDGKFDLFDLEEYEKIQKDKIMVQDQNKSIQ